MKKLLYLLLFIFVFSNSFSQPCLPEGIVFSSQADIDSFQVNYPNCSEIEGDILISGEDITNLNGLNVLTLIGGDLSIGELYIGNPGLTSLNGLQGLIEINGDLNIISNSALNNLSGLGKLTTISGAFRLSKNNALTDFKGLDSLSYIGGHFNIYQNGSLSSFNGLSNLSVLNGSLSINGNGNITNLSGFDNLTTILGTLMIYNSFKLVNLVGLDNLSFIGKDFDLTNNDLISLTGLESLDSIGGGLFIDDIYHLVNLNGLESLVSIGSDLSLFNNVALYDISALSNLESIGGDLQCLWNEDLASLDGLNSVEFVGGDLIINSNYFLDNLNGLSGITEIGGKLSIAGNPSLSDLTGLINLSSIDGDLRIQGNYILTDLYGLENIDPSSIHNLYINNNASLTECSINSVCGFLWNPSGSVNIYNNAPDCNNPPEVAAGCGITLFCLPYGNYYFNSQTEIDDFSSNYPDCHDLYGNVIIEGKNITNLNGLSGITSIEGWLGLSNNDSLINFTGLNSLKAIGAGMSVGGFQDGNKSLVDFTGLDSLQKIGGTLSIYFNHVLTNMTGLKNLRSVGHLEIGSNDQFNSLNGLISLDTIHEDLTINANRFLKSLTGLEQLVYVGSSIYIRNNDSLTSLNGIQNIEPDSIYVLNIQSNLLLSHCEVESVCEYLSVPEAFVFIQNNKTGCNSREEVEEACSVSIPELVNQLSTVSFPNPFSNSITIEYTLNQPAVVTITIFNHLGKQIDFIRGYQQGGKQSLQWQPQGLPSGMYYFRLQAGDQISTGMVVKML